VCGRIHRADRTVTAFRENLPIFYDHRAHRLGQANETNILTIQRKYPQKQRQIIAHELHHAAFDESDEYCCDGGYKDGVNLYNSLKSCQDKGSDWMSCAMIDLRDKMGMVIDSRPWWRSDTGTADVMYNNRIENPDDLRASDALFAKCLGGGC